ncbi:MAG: peptidoglycan-binding protein [Propioniciclava sp.]|uniref:peptidoglycan-binding protein n=1 Tax=Propioniciclava sp. TaxID=2038686 RepID=UPI0039E68B55
MKDHRRLAGRRRVFVVLVLTGALAASGWLFWPRSRAVSTEPPREPVTAAVERVTLTSQVRLSAQLGYGDPVALPERDGMITALPAPAAVVGRGEQVYEVDGASVVLFQGARPFWRELSVDAPDGADVRQLQENLAALGWFKGRVTGRFQASTQRAVRAWQKSLGLEQTGVFSPSSVVVAASPRIRIAQVTARLGERGVSPATYTETTVRANARLTEAQARDLVAGTAVTVVLNDGTQVEARLSVIDPGGHPDATGESTTNPSATVDIPDQQAVSSAGSTAVRVVVSGGEQPPTLVVPAASLLASAGDGYAVEVERGDGFVRTPVAIGLVADARVQVLASGSEVEGGEGPVLAEGDRVVLAR